MAESMIDRVARALALADLDPESRRAVNIDAHMAHVRSHYEELARAAIGAMREPTDVMQNAIRPQSYTIEHYHGSGHHRTFPALGSGPIGAWHDMIDAALNEHANTR